MSSFDDFQLQPALRQALAVMHITEPTPIQAEAIPALLVGQDVVGRSATGSGKTLAYALPMVERLSGNKRVAQALILLPTRELALQVNNVVSKLANGKKLTTALLVGGRPYEKQMQALRYGSQIIIGTPGRIKDHLDRGSLVLNQIRMCVLDEADQMLDSGFAPAIEEILTNTPETKQMALFSATIPAWVAKLEEKFLKDPVRVDITSPEGDQSTIERITYQVTRDQKMAALCTLLSNAEGKSSLIFGRTKFGVEKLGKQLSDLGLAVGTLHGNKSQRAREDVLMAFRTGRVQTLLATDVAARGLDIQGIGQVINYELPETSEMFTHRIGRTGRMGRHGKAITLVVPAEMGKWRRMARTLGHDATLERLTIEANIDFSNKPAAAAPVEVQVQEPVSKRRPSREREQAAPTPKQARSKATPARDDRYSIPAARKQQKRRASEPIPMFPVSWEPEFIDYSERPDYGRARNDRDRVQQRASANRTTGRQKTSSFAPTDSWHTSDRRRSSRPMSKRIGRGRVASR